MSISLNNELIYSYSRAKTLDDCPRKYYYSYYAATGGWRQDAMQRTKQIYRLKKLQPIQAMVGESIHFEIAVAATDASLKKFDFKRGVNKRIREEYRKSISQKNEWIQNPRLFTMVQEVYYFNSVNDETQQKIIDKIDTCAETIDQCKSLCEIRSGATIMLLDELQEFYFANDSRTYIKVDALYQKEDSSGVVLVDWKTGQGSEAELDQLLIYTYFIHQKYGIPAETIESRLEYLVDGDCASYCFTDEDMQMAEKMIQEGIYKMQNCLRDKGRNISNPELFFQKNQSTRCRFCNFQEVCFDGILKSLTRQIDKATLIVGTS